MKRNKSTSAKRAMRRRFALLALLHRRPHRYNEIISALDTQQLFVYDHASDAQDIARQQQYQFRYDLRALRLLDFSITFDKKNQYYTWHNSPFGLSLEESYLKTFAILLETFTTSSFLHADTIRAFLASLAQQLPDEQQKALHQIHPPFKIELSETADYKMADPLTIHRIEVAIQQRRQLNFRYQSPRHEKIYIHTIEPDALILKDGHVYIHGWHVYQNNECKFRLDYVIAGSAEVQSKQIASTHPPRPPYVVSYRLSPLIARHSVSQHFPEQHIEKHDDGSATVIANVTDLFEARRILLGYGENCTVLGPPELLAQMRSVAHHYTIYLTGEE